MLSALRTSPASEALRTRLFWVVLALGVVDRVCVLLQFGLTHVGVDDAVIWWIARDFGNGVFREPFMYGQNYNLMLEALLAAPFMRFGIDPWVILPIVTSVLALLPFWSFALWCRWKGHGVSAVAIAFMPLLLPVEWAVTTSMSRGFVQGIAILSVLPWLLSIERSWLRNASIACALSWSMIAEPNAIILAIPFATWWLWREGKHLRMWLAALLGCAPAVWFAWWSYTFYASHPELLVHTLDNAQLGFDVNWLFLGLSRLDLHFRQLAPIPNMAGFLVGGALLTLIVLLVRQRAYTALWPMVAGVAGILVALCFAKVHDGCASVFYPLGRMFLGIPVLLASGFAVVLWRARSNGSGAVLITIGAVALVLWKWQRTEAVIAHELKEQSCAYVREEPIEVIRTKCIDIARKAQRAQVDLIVPLRWPRLKDDHRKHFEAYFICYACPMVLPDFPPVYGAEYDRRSWIRERYANTPPGTLLLIGGTGNVPKAMAERPLGIRDLGPLPGDMYVVRSYTVETDRILEDLWLRGRGY